jgi:hypothetical protein
MLARPILAFPCGMIGRRRRDVYGLTRARVLTLDYAYADIRSDAANDEQDEGCD